MLNFFQHFAHRKNMKEKRTDYQKLYTIAENQAGYFTNKQALTAGYSRDLLSHLVTAGKFLRVQRGIYRLRTFPDMPYSDYFQIWLSTGMNGVFSHQSALALYGLTDRIPTEYHVTVPRTSRRDGEGIRYHTSKLMPEEITVRHGLPVTDISRTLYDLHRGGESPEWIIQAAQQALERGMISEDRLRRRLEFYSKALMKLLLKASLIKAP
jgi:predicted transcriptional regulator of viral defense system